MSVTDPATTSPAVNIEDIMQDVRDEILSRTLPEQARRRPGARTLPPDFYEHLYRAGLAQAELTIKPLIVKSNTPVIGPLIDWIRLQFHQLVGYYFDHLAYRQSEINQHLLQALRQLDMPADDQTTTGDRARIGHKAGFKSRWDDRATPEDVLACFHLLLNRDPDEQEWGDWMERLDSQEIKRSVVVDSFLNHPEFAANHPTQNKSAPDQVSSK